MFTLAYVFELVQHVAPIQSVIFTCRFTSGVVQTETGCSIYV